MVYNYNTITLHCTVLCTSSTITLHCILYASDTIRLHRTAYCMFPISLDCIGLHRIVYYTLHHTLNYTVSTQLHRIGLLCIALYYIFQYNCTAPYCVIFLILSAVVLTSCGIQCNPMQCNGIRITHTSVKYSTDVSILQYVSQIDYLSDNEDRPKDMAVRGEKVEASERLSAILLLSITATLCLSTSLFVLFAP
jgi:hypothetical protein